MDLDIVLILVFAATLLCLYFFSQSPNNPPGPYGVPLLGNLLQLGKKPYMKFQREWKKKYGPIVSIKFGSYPSIVVSDAKIIKSIFNNQKLSSRPELPFVCLRSRDVCPRGILFTSGDQHAEQRKAVVKFLKESGFGKSSHETIILGQIRDCLDYLEKAENNPVTVKHFFHSYILKILWPIVAGEDAGDHEVLSKIFMESTRIQEETLSASSLSIFMPWWARLFPNLSGFNLMNSQLPLFFDFFTKYVNEHKVRYENEPGAGNDVIMSYIHEMKTTTNPSSSFHGEVGEKNLMTVLLDLFFAGTETSALTISWAILFLVKYPEVQEKAWEEINRVLDGRLPSFTDEPTMIYMQALIQETLRYSSLLPLGLFRTTIEDTELEGYLVPKETLIFLNLYGAHHDEEYWGDPEVFRPERFLSPDGQQLVKHDSFFPFGLGKRLCIGETLARKQVFMFATCILQKFKITAHESNPEISMEPVAGFTLSPQTYKFNFSVRE